MTRTLALSRPARLAALSAAALLTLTACGGSDEPAAGASSSSAPAAGASSSSAPATASASTSAPASESASASTTEPASATESASATASTTESASATGSASASSSATGSASSSAAAADYTPGTCFTAPVGARDLTNYETVDCAGEHTAEYLWAVPAADPDAEAPTTAPVCAAEGARLAKEEDRLNGAVVTAGELSAFGSEETHCVVYAVAGSWTGQLADPAITLEKATEQNAAATS